MSDSPAVATPVLEAEKPRPEGLLRKNVWAMADQVLISAANFITMILLARALGAASFGAFTLAYSALLFANILQSTLVTQPMNVLGATKDRYAFGTFIFSMSFAQAGITLAEVLCTAVVAVVAALNGWSSAGVLLALVVAIPAWQAQEFLRRVLYTQRRFRDAFFVDAVSYCCQAAGIVALGSAHLLNGERAMYVIAASTTLAAVLGVLLVRESVVWKFDRLALKESWHFGKWLTGGELLQWACSLQMYLYLAAAILGTVASGELRAAQILFGPTRVFAFYLGSVLPMQFARALVSGGHRAVHEQLVHASTRVLPLLGLYAIVVAIFAHPLLDFMYPEKLANEPVVLVIYSAAAFIEYVQLLLTAALSAKRMTKVIFFAQIAGVLITALCSWWIIQWLGVSGAPLALGVSTATITAILFRCYMNSMQTAPTDSVEVSTLQAVAGRSAQPGDDTANAADELPRVKLLERVLASLDSASIPWCITHGYRALGDRVSGDVDCIIPAEVGPRRLREALLSCGQGQTPNEVVQWFSDRAIYIVISESRAVSPAMVALHVSPDFELDGVVYYHASEILASRRRRGSLSVPAPEIELACVLLNRATKGVLKPSHQACLSELLAESPEKCEQEMRRFWGEQTAAFIASSIRAEDWCALEQALPRLASEARARIAPGQRSALVARKVAASGRRVSRWLRPRSGFHAVFLGPDGVGKSTVIEGVRSAMSPAFLNTSYHTFAPSLLPQRMQPEKPTPHALPPRSYAASLLKAAWWLVCYTGGYLVTIHPERVRGGFAMNHRYLLDAIVDQKRYRYSGPAWLLRAIWFIAPKPDMVILLDAPTEVIQARKKEVAFEETARQRTEYRRLVSAMRYGVIVDAARPVDEVVAEVNAAIMKRLSSRIASSV